MTFIKKLAIVASLSAIIASPASANEFLVQMLQQNYAEDTADFNHHAKQRDNLVEALKGSLVNITTEFHEQELDDPKKCGPLPLPLKSLDLAVKAAELDSAPLVDELDAAVKRCDDEKIRQMHESAFGE